MKNLHQTITIIKEVEKTHKNLGLPLIFAKMIDFSNLGLFLIAERGKGKTAILEALIGKPMQHRTILKVGAITFKGLKKIAYKLDRNTVTVINPDFSTLYSEYLREVAVNLFSQLLYDHAISEMHTAQYDIEIEDCYISFLSGMQPQMYRTVSTLPTFESMYKDRFIRFFMLYPLGTPKYQPEPPKIKAPIIFEAISFDAVRIEPKILKHKLYKKLVKLMGWHTSEGRAEDYVQRLLKASAKINNRLYVTESDLKLLDLYQPYLMMEKWISERLVGVAEPLQFNPHSYVIFFRVVERGEVKRSDLKKEFQVSYVTLHNNIKPLMAQRLIKGKFGTATYRVHPEWEKKYLKPIREFHELLL